VGPAVTTDDGVNGDILALNAGAMDSLLRVHLPRSICALFHDESECHRHSACVFCHTPTNLTTYCYPAEDFLPAEYVSYLLTDRVKC